MALVRLEPKGYLDQYVVTDKGSERIEGLDKRIIQVSYPIC